MLIFSENCDFHLTRFEQFYVRCLLEVFSAALHSDLDHGIHFGPSVKARNQYVLCPLVVYMHVGLHANVCYAPYNA